MLAFDAPVGCGRIIHAETRPGYVLAIRWEDGSSDLVDLTDLICGNRHFKCLKVPEAFAKAVVLEEGHGIRWNGGPDLSAETLHAIAGAQRKVRASSC